VIGQFPALGIRIQIVVLGEIGSLLRTSFESNMHIEMIIYSVFLRTSTP